MLNCQELQPNTHTLQNSFVSNILRQLMYEKLFPSNFVTIFSPKQQLSFVTLRKHMSILFFDILMSTHFSCDVEYLTNNEGGTI